MQETVADVRAILDGKVDSLKPEDILYIGKLKDVEDKLSSKSIVKTAPTDTSNMPSNTPEATKQAEEQQAAPPQPTTQQAQQTG